MYSISEILISLEKEGLSVDLTFTYKNISDFLSYNFVLNKDGEIIDFPFYSLEESLQTNFYHLEDKFKGSHRSEMFDLDAIDMTNTVYSFIEKTDFWELFSNLMFNTCKKINDIGVSVFLKDITPNTSKDILSEEASESFYLFNAVHEDQEISVYIDFSKENSDISEDQLVLEFKGNNIEYYLTYDLAYDFPFGKESRSLFESFKKELLQDKKIRLKKILK